MKKCSKTGFTMIELIIVIAILGIIMSLAIPNIKMHSFTHRAQALQLCSDIRNIRYLSMTKGRHYWIFLDRNFYKIREGTKVIKKVNMDNGNEIFYTNQEIMFSYIGAPVYGGTTITIYNKYADKSYRITIVPASGRTMIKSYN